MWVVSMKNVTIVMHMYMYMYMYMYEDDEKVMMCSKQGNT